MIKTLFEMPTPVAGDPDRDWLHFDWKIQTDKALVQPIYPVTIRPGQKLVVTYDADGMFRIIREEPDETPPPPMAT